MPQPPCCSSHDLPCPACCRAALQLLLSACLLTSPAPPSTDQPPCCACHRRAVPAARLQTTGCMMTKRSCWACCWPCRPTPSPPVSPGPGWDGLDGASAASRELAWPPWRPGSSLQRSPVGEAPHPLLSARRPDASRRRHPRRHRRPRRRPAAAGVCGVCRQLPRLPGAQQRDGPAAAGAPSACQLCGKARPLVMCPTDHF